MKFQRVTSQPNDAIDLRTYPGRRAQIYLPGWTIGATFEVIFRDGKYQPFQVRVITPVATNIQPLTATEQDWEIPPQPASLNFLPETRVARWNNMDGPFLLSQDGRVYAYDGWEYNLANSMWDARTGYQLDRTDPGRPFGEQVWIRVNRNDHNIRLSETERQDYVYKKYKRTNTGHLVDEQLRILNRPKPICAEDVFGRTKGEGDEDGLWDRIKEAISDGWEDYLEVAQKPWEEFKRFARKIPGYDELKRIEDHIKEILPEEAITILKQIRPAVSLLVPAAVSAAVATSSTAVITTPGVTAGIQTPVSGVALGPTPIGMPVPNPTEIPALEPVIEASEEAIKQVQETKILEKYTRAVAADPKNIGLQVVLDFINDIKRASGVDLTPLFRLLIDQERNGQLQPNSTERKLGKSTSELGPDLARYQIEREMRLLNYALYGLLGTLLLRLLKRKE